MKEVLHRKSKVETLSRSCVNFLPAIREVCGSVSCLGFLRKILQGAALSGTMAVGHYFKIERSFVKDLSNSLKTFYHFATMLQNILGAGPLPCVLRV